jgi:hypothetical protein
MKKRLIVVACILASVAFLVPPRELRAWESGAWSGVRRIPGDLQTGGIKWTSKPDTTCAPENKGTVYLGAAGDGADTLRLCGKNSSGAHVWTELENKPSLPPTGSITYEHIDEANLVIQRSADCSLLSALAVGELCVKSTDESLWTATAVGSPGTWAKAGCVNNYLKIRANGDAGDSTNTEVNFIAGTNTTVTRGGTATAPTIAINASGGATGQEVLTKFVKVGQVTVTGTTLTTCTGFSYTLPAGTLAANEGLLVVVNFTTTAGNTGNSNVRARFGTSNFVNFSVVANDRRTWPVYIMNNGATNAQVYFGDSYANPAGGTMAIDTSANVVIDMQISNFDADDSASCWGMIVQHIQQ